jgi:hypothetical protein
MVDRSAKQSVKAEGFSRTRVSRRSKSDSLANSLFVCLFDSIRLFTVTV